jgi:hypothetical protein
VFRAVRLEALRRGVRFTSRGGSPLERLYYAFPLMSLDEVIDARTIPYRANFPWLEILERRAPGGFTLDDLKRGELQFNYLFHESAHLIAHDELFGHRSPPRLPKTAATLLGVMVGEAFANTAECLSAAFAEGEIAAYFLDANCHFRANEREVAELRRAAGRFGFPAAAKVLLGAFLYSNYLYETLTARELRRVARFAGLAPGAPIARLARIGLQLNEKFRATTTPLHLRKTGFGAGLARQFAADPLRLLEGKPALRRKARRLAELVAAGLAL